MQKGKIYLKDASWWFRYRTPVIQDGKKVWKDAYVKLAPAAQFSSAAAVEKAGLVAKHRAGLDTSRMTPSTMQLVSDFIEYIYFPKKREANFLRPSTLNGYEHIYKRHIKPRLNGQRMCDFKLQEAQHFLDGIAKDTPLSTTSLKHIKWLCVAVFNFAAQNGAYNSDAKNPFFETTVPKGQRPSERTRFATLDTVIRMVEVLDEPAATVVALAAFSGLRKSEIQGLKWEDLKNNEMNCMFNAPHGVPPMFGSRQRQKPARLPCLSFPSLQNIWKRTVTNFQQSSSSRVRRWVARSTFTTSQIV